MLLLPRGQRRVSAGEGGSNLSAGLTSKLFSVYKFNDGALGTDELGNNNLALVGTPTYIADGPSGSAMNCGARAGGIGSSHSFDHPSLSVSVWIRSTNSTNYQTIFAVNYSTILQGFMAMPTNSNLFYRFPGGPVLYADIFGDQRYLWNHYAMAFDGVNQTMTGWLNGVVKVDAAAYSYNLQASGDRLCVGTSKTPQTDGIIFYGYLAECYFANEVFTSDDVAELYNGGTGNFY